MLHELRATRTTCLQLRWIAETEYSAAVLHRVSDKAALAAILDRERAWAIYALADLDDNLFAQCDWWQSGDGLALLFRGLDIRPLFLMGPPADVRTLLAGIPVDDGYLNLREEHCDAAEGLFAFTPAPHAMWRMLLGPFMPVGGETVPLGPDDLSDIQQLYATGTGAGIAFAPAQLHTGVFRGVRQQSALVAVAGAQVVSAGQGVAAVGNVFVRPDHRGRGLAQRALSATVEAIRARGIDTIGLNVARENAAAVHAYEKLGFQTVLRYVEGPAARVAPR